MNSQLITLKLSLDGDLYLDEAMRVLYATDASVYQELPLAVARPKGSKDLKKLIAFAHEEQTSLIPRAAGTSLAGQCVGNGIVVDVSKYMTDIIELNQEQKWVRVQPGVIRDELNSYLAQFGLFFGPETSTGNRCMMGGMVGNNACGAHSLIYGSTRDHTLEIVGILSDGSDVEFKPVSRQVFAEKCLGSSFENQVYAMLDKMFLDVSFRNEITQQYPKKSIKRRNTGYALDLLAETQPWTEQGDEFNFCKMLAGSEGTLVFTTEIKLNLVDIPPPVKAVVAIHCQSLSDSLKANLIALKYQPGAIELIDDIILQCTKQNSQQSKNRFFVQGDPKALLVVEFARQTLEEINALVQDMSNEIKSAGYGYNFPVIYGKDINKVWALRKAGLGLLSNIPGDLKAVACIEDTAVHPDDLPDYIDEFGELLQSYGLSCVHYAHTATGELHLRPLLNLKASNDVEKFHDIAEAVAKLVKKYQGSLSGEHGDGRLRGEFIEHMYSEKINQAFLSIKNCFDPEGIFNPGKIVNTPKMNESLRYERGQIDQPIDTLLDFDADEGIQKATERCTGSADCRKSKLSAGTMCPSYMATKDESSSTRARANILRHYLTHSALENRFNHQEIFDVMDLCLSCKGCKSECPSDVDMAKLKAEFLYQYYRNNSLPFRSKVFGHIGRINAFNSKFSGLVNFFLKRNFIASISKQIIGIAPQRSIPLLSNQTIRQWYRKYYVAPKKPKASVYLFCDEFTNFNEAQIGIKAIQLLTALAIEVKIPAHYESARAYISKGMLKQAQNIANKNVALLAEIVKNEMPLIGIEPSAILTFRDEYIDLTIGDVKTKAKALAKNTFTIEEYLAKFYESRNFDPTIFTDKVETIKLHEHCFQKSLSSVDYTKKILSIPKNYTVEIIPSGCCGMAGSFGFEKEHFELSMQVGELVLFPVLREASSGTIIVAPGTSCRQQIADAVHKTALHPVEVLFNALL